MEPTTLIGLTGKATSGKSTVAKMTGYYTLSFATPLREMLLTMGVAPAELAHKEDVISWLEVTPRHLLQTLGTEWGREMIHPDLWVLIAKRKLEKLRDLSRLVPGRMSRIIFDDVRFANEAQMIIDAGGIIVEVKRPFNIRAVYAHAHKSENGLPTELITHRIHNVGDSDHLFKEVAKIPGICGVGLNHLA